MKDPMDQSIMTMRQIIRTMTRRSQEKSEKLGKRINVKKIA
jgi:hypothetical protein